MGLFGRSKPQVSVTELYTPYEKLQRENVMGTATDTYNARKKADLPYTGASPVPFDPNTFKAQGMALSAADTMGQLSPLMVDAMKFGLNAADVANNPVLQQAIQRTQQSMMDQFQGAGGVAESLRTGFQGGGYGGSRQAIAEGVAAGKLLQAQGDVAANMNLQGYNQGLNTMLQTMQLAPVVNNSLLAPARVTETVGAQNEAQAQAQQNYLAAAAGFTQDRDWRELQNYANLIYGAGSSKAQTTTPGAQTSPLQAAMGGAMIGGAVGGPTGAAIGGVAGLLFA